jgi:hypothetical protein
MLAWRSILTELHEADNERGVLRWNISLWDTQIYCVEIYAVNRSVPGRLTFLACEQLQ